jgi:mRNA-degrading endonuclease RelE of RelBE toxin-antitoxin system
MKVKFYAKPYKDFKSKKWIMAFESDEQPVCYDRLKDNPKIYQLCDYQNFKEKGYRKAVIKNYVLTYRIDEETNTVYILHFVYGRQDYYSII